jgi:hypothetical protein
MKAFRFDLVCATGVEFSFFSFKSIIYFWIFFIKLYIIFILYVYLIYTHLIIFVISVTLKNSPKIGLFFKVTEITKIIKILNTYYLNG